MRYSLLLLWDKMCADGAVPIQHQLDTPLLQNVWYQKSETETQKNCRTIRSSCNETRDTFSTSWKNTTFSCGKIWCNLCLISLILCTIVTYKYNKIGIGGLLATPPFCRHILLPSNFLEQKNLYILSPYKLYLNPAQRLKMTQKVSFYNAFRAHAFEFSRQNIFLDRTNAINIQMRYFGIIFKTLWKAGILIICFSHTGKSGQTSNPLRDLRSLIPNANTPWATLFYRQH